MTFIIFKVK